MLKTRKKIKKKFVLSKFRVFVVSFYSRHSVFRIPKSAFDLLSNLFEKF